MTQAQLYSEIFSLLAKNQIEHDHGLEMNLKEAQKEVLHAAKKSFCK